MSSASIGRRLEAELGSIAERCGCDLLAAQFASGVLRLVLDRAPDGNGDENGGVTLKDCERVSREASAFLDVEDFASGRYVLEVSSPGLDREFYRESDYERFAGENVKITWRDPESGVKRTEIGGLSRPEGPDKRLTLKTESDTLAIRLQDVITTRLEPAL